jgi:hypothetical protein
LTEKEEGEVAASPAMQLPLPPAPPPQRCTPSSLRAALLSIDSSIVQEQTVVPFSSHEFNQQKQLIKLLHFQ